jgi:1-deoxy-D-xylulose-5-phosphate synthase
VREGKEIAILSFGALLSSAQPAAEALDASLLDMRFIKPLDEAMLETLSKSHRLWVTLEENAVQGGAGSAVNEWLMRQGLSLPVLNLGLPDRFVEQGTQAQQLASIGLDPETILTSIKAFSASHPV